MACNQTKPHTTNTFFFFLVSHHHFSLPSPFLLSFLLLFSHSYSCTSHTPSKVITLFIDRMQHQVLNFFSFLPSRARMEIPLYSIHNWSCPLPRWGTKSGCHVTILSFGVNVKSWHTVQSYTSYCTFNNLNFYINTYGVGTKTHNITFNKTKLGVVIPSYHIQVEWDIPICSGKGLVTWSASEKLSPALGGKLTQQQQHLEPRQQHSDSTLITR